MATQDPCPDKAQGCAREKAVKHRHLVAGDAMVLVACGLQPGPAPHPSGTVAPSVPGSPGISCTNMPPIYHPKRLQVLQACISFEGVVLADLHEQDGDRHLWIKPDIGYESYLNPSNTYHGKRALVAEIVPQCAKEPANEEAAAACPSSPIQPPEVGAHVEVTGRYVIDTIHGWAEVHPVASVKVLTP